MGLKLDHTYTVKCYDIIISKYGIRDDQLLIKIHAHEELMIHNVRSQEIVKLSDVQSRGLISVLKKEDFKLFINELQQRLNDGTYEQKKDDEIKEFIAESYRLEQIKYSQPNRDNHEVKDHSSSYTGLTDMAIPNTQFWNR